MLLRETHLVVTCVVESTLHLLLFLHSYSLARSCTYHCSCASVKNIMKEKKTNNVFMLLENNLVFSEQLHIPGATQECVDHTWRISALRNM